MGYVDRGGGREGKGVSLRRSKKNPGCGASRQLHKNANANSNNPTRHEIAQRLAVVPPPMFTLPMQDIHHAATTTSSFAKPTSWYARKLSAANVTEVLAAATATIEELVSFQQQQLCSPMGHPAEETLAFDLPHELVTQLSPSAASPASPETTSSPATAPYLLDGAVSLLSRLLAAESASQLSQRALEESNVSGLICWSSEVERQPALVTHCETALQSVTYEVQMVPYVQTTTTTTMSLERRVEEEETGAARREGEEGNSLRNGILKKNSSRKEAQQNPKQRSAKRKEEEFDAKRVHFDPEGHQITEFHRDEPLTAPKPHNNNSNKNPNNHHPQNDKDSHDDHHSSSHAVTSASTSPASFSSAGSEGRTVNTPASNSSSTAVPVFASLSQAVPYAVVGIHPNNIDRMNQPLQEQWLVSTASMALKHVSPGALLPASLAPSSASSVAVVRRKGVLGGPAVVGILSGLDLSRKPGTHHAQEWTLRQLYKMAAVLSLPLILHLRVNAAAGGNNNNNNNNNSNNKEAGNEIVMEEEEVYTMLGGDSRTRQAMANTGDRLAELLSSWCPAFRQKRERSLQQADTARRQRCDEDDVVRGIDGNHTERENDSDSCESDEEEQAVDDEPTTDPGLGILHYHNFTNSSSNNPGSPASRHPPSVVLHNAWGTLALSPALQELFVLSRPEPELVATRSHSVHQKAQNGNGKEEQESITKTKKRHREPPLMYLSLSAEDMLSPSWEMQCVKSLRGTAVEPALVHTPKSDRERLLEVLPSLFGCLPREVRHAALGSEGDENHCKLEQQHEEDISPVSFSQLLITTASPWHTPQNLDDEYLRTRPNEPSNLPSVLKAVVNALSERLWRRIIRLYHPSPEALTRLTAFLFEPRTRTVLGTILSHVSTVNHLAVFFGRYWVHQFQHELPPSSADALPEGGLEPAATALEASLPLPAGASLSAPSTAADRHPFFQDAEGSQQTFVCAQCGASLFTGDQALWHRLGEVVDATPPRSVVECRKDSKKRHPMKTEPVESEEEEDDDEVDSMRHPNARKGRRHKTRKQQNASQEPAATANNSQKKKSEEAALAQLCCESAAGGRVQLPIPLSRAVLLSEYEQQQQQQQQQQSKRAAAASALSSSCNESVRLWVHSASVQPALRTALQQRYGKAFWLSPPQQGAVASSAGGPPDSTSSKPLAVSCSACKAKLGVVRAVALHTAADPTAADESSSEDDVDALVLDERNHKQRRKQGGRHRSNESDSSSSDSNEEDNSGEEEEDVERYLIGKQNNKKRRHDKLAQKKKLKKLYHEKHQQHGGAGVAQQWCGGSATAFPFAGDPLLCERCEQPLFWEGNTSPGAVASATTPVRTVLAFVLQLDSHVTSCSSTLSGGSRREMGTAKRGILEENASDDEIEDDGNERLVGRNALHSSHTNNNNNKEKRKKDQQEPPQSVMKSSMKQKQKKKNTKRQEEDDDVGEDEEGLEAFGTAEASSLARELVRLQLDQQPEQLSLKKGKQNNTNNNKKNKKTSNHQRGAAVVASSSEEDDDEAAPSLPSSTSTTAAGQRGVAEAASTKEDTVLTRLLAEAAAEREQIERERKDEEERQAAHALAQKQEMLKKKTHKKNVKANNRSNFTHFRNKDFGKNVPGGNKPAVSSGVEPSSSDESSDAD